MTKEALIEMLGRTHEEGNRLLNNLDEGQFAIGLHGKWSPAEHVIHLRKSIEPLSKALSKPRLALTYLFGKPNRPVRSYDAVKERYYTKLADVPAGVTSPFVPNEKDNLKKAKY